jgi:hypothetical protein
MTRSLSDVSWLKNAAAFKYSFVSLNCCEISAGEGLRTLYLPNNILFNEISNLQLRKRFEDSIDIIGFFERIEIIEEFSN